MAQKPISRDIAQQALNMACAEGGVAAAARKYRIADPTLRHRVGVARAMGLSPTGGIDDPDNPDHMRQRIKRLESDLASAQKKALNEADIRRHIVGLAADVTITEPPKWLLSTTAPASSPGVPTLFCSDWHTGEVVQPSQINGVNKYNMTIFHDRVKTLVASTLHLLRIISPKMDYPGIVLALGGDMISGNIHDELTATNELNTMPTVIELYGVLVWLIDELLKVFPRVFVPCVTGNHGRDTVKIWNKDRHATSFDWLLYCFLAKHYEGDKRVSFLIPDGPDAYYRIYGYRYLLTHGDQFRGGDGMIGALGPIIRGDHRKRSRNSQISMEYETMILGHWHQYMHLTRLIVNGSLKGMDEYAYNNNFPFEFPQQALWLTHPKNGITFRMPVFVGSRAKTEIVREWVGVSA